MDLLWRLLAEDQIIRRVRWEDMPAAWQVFLIVVLVLAFAGATYLLEPKGERRGLKLPFETIHQWGIGRSVPDHNVGS